MKAHFVVLLGLASLVVTNVANAKRVGNLTIVLDGPFSVCEEGHTLKINIPNLHLTHYVPGFTASWNQRPLGVGMHGTEYPRYPNSVHYVMDSPWGVQKPGGDMVREVPKIKATSDKSGDKPTRDSDQADSVYLYSEKGDCSGLISKSVSVSFTVPEPDVIYPMEHAGQTSWIADENNLSHGPDDCKHIVCRYATEVVLLYANVDFDSPIRIYEAGTTPNCDDPSTTWCPDASVLTGGNYEIKLDTQPKALPFETLGMAHLQSKSAFKKAGALMGKKRILTYDEGQELPHGMQRNIAAGKPTTDWIAMQEMNFAPRHNNCGVAMMFFCSSGTVCQQSH
jgi:hypothetical protein